ncbi:MAG: hypothetical protein AB8F78_14545 [Saprospiraceae bacterium]
MRLILPILVLIASVFVACGSETLEEKLNRKLSEAVSEASGSEVNLDNLQDAVKQATDKLENLDLNGMDDVEVINFRELKKLMPKSAAGMDRTKHIGETTSAMGFTFSKAEARYGEGDKRIDATFIDSGGAGSLLMGMAGFANLNVDKETEQGSERTLKIDGNQAYEKYSNRNGRITSELSVLVNERFIVTLKGKDVDADDLMDVYKDFSLSSLPVKEDAAQ